MVAPAEVEVVRAVGIALVRRRAPVDAVRTNEVLTSTAAITRSREEDALAVLLARHLVTVVTVLSCTFPGTVIKQFEGTRKMMKGVMGAGPMGNMMRGMGRRR